MSGAEECAFCDREQLYPRMIHEDKLCVSFVSSPWFRWGQSLVIPKRHVEEIIDMSSDEMVAVMTEIGRLSLKLNLGFGKGLLQKDQPHQPENGIKMNHLHFHIAPRFETDEGLFPVPDPNSFEGFVMPTDAEIAEVLEQTR